MQTTTEPHNQDASGRASVRVAGQLRSDISSGHLEAGQFLPNERELAKTLNVSRETLRRALKGLEREGFVATVPRRGYRVLARTNDPDKGSPVAYVLSSDQNSDLAIGGAWTDRIDMVLAAFQKASGRRGWPLLVVGAPGTAAEEVLHQLRSTRACGLVLDTIDPKVVALAREAGMPAVVTNDWSPDCPLDSVMQDGQHGGMLAVEHLLARGRRRLAFVGAPLAGNIHAVDRYSGVAAALELRGLELSPEQRVYCTASDAAEKITRLLSGSNRPDGIIAPWSHLAAATCQAARRLGLEPGRDFDLVGWSVDELYASAYRTAFNGAGAPPAVVWSAAAMAEAAMNRLVERRTNPHLPAMRIKVPVQLRAEA